MRFLSKHVTYANVISSLALFIALGGISYAAATLPKNSVTAKQIKTGAVTESKIAKNAVTGAKIKGGTITADKIANGVLTSADINVASLGKVASASVADSVATQATPIVKRVGPSASNASTIVALNQGTEIPLASNGQVSIYAKCVTIGSSTYAYLLEKTDTDGALTAYTSGGNYFYGSPYLNVLTPEDQRYFAYTSSSGNGSSYLSSNYYGFQTIVGTDGLGIAFQGYAWVKTGTPALGNGAYGPGNVCIFTGSATKLTLN